MIKKRNVVNRPGEMTEGAKREREVLFSNKRFLGLAAFSIVAWGIFIYILMGAPGLLNTPSDANQPIAWTDGNTVYAMLAGIVAVASLIMAFAPFEDIWEATEAGARYDAREQ
jgi:hypothetical protein